MIKTTAADKEIFFMYRVFGNIFFKVWAFLADLLVRENQLNVHSCLADIVTEFIHNNITS